MRIARRIKRRRNGSFFTITDVLHHAYGALTSDFANGVGPLHNNRQRGWGYFAVDERRPIHGLFNATSLKDVIAATCTWHKLTKAQAKRRMAR